MGKVAGIARRDEKRGDMQELESADVTRETGVANDFRGKQGKRQVTVLSAEAWHQACSDLGRELPWTTRRANVLVEGVDLPRSPGAVLEIGELRLEITMETDPCSRMDEQCPGLRKALLPDWRGGVCCRVLAGGRLTVGDSVHVTAVAGPAAS